MLVTICDICGKKISERDSVIHAGTTLDRRSFHPACVPALRRLIVKLGVQLKEAGVSNDGSVTRKK